MSRTNHRRKNPKRSEVIQNGWMDVEKPWRYIEKGGCGWNACSTLSDRTVGASIGREFTDGHRGMAKAVRGAKKYVRSRIRFHDKTAVRKIVSEQNS